MGWLASMMSVRGLLVGLDESRLDPDPFAQFSRWFTFAKRARCPWPTSFCLSTVSDVGRPAARMMLLKGFDLRGFVFYTHYVGRKAMELDGCPFAAMTFHWVELVRQVRIEGRVVKIARAESEAYFRSRLRLSQIGAWASRQSRPLESRAAFDARVEAFEKEFHGRDVPLPDHWGGYRVVPDRFEFWQGRPGRLHDRFVYTPAEAGGWTITRLNP